MASGPGRPAAWYKVLDGTEVTIHSDGSVTRSSGTWNWIPDFPNLWIFDPAETTLGDGRVSQAECAMGRHHPRQGRRSSRITSDAPWPLSRGSDRGVFPLLPFCCPPSRS